VGDLRYAGNGMRFGVYPAALIIFVAFQAHAQSVPPAAPHSARVLTEGAPGLEQSAAQEHFERALSWYRAGKYQRAVQELEAALVRDSGGKDLVFNLALVQEKLGDLAGAIGSLERFRSLEQDPAELDRAALTIQRLQGARAELLAGMRHGSETLRPCPTPRVRGKLDAWVLSSGSLAIASLLVGTVLGVRAITLNARGEQGRSRDSAVLADLALATSLLAGAGAVALYFGRYSDMPSGQTLALMPRNSALHLEFRF
jgi:tetratricopeptide (TPR) repeat protein